MRVTIYHNPRCSKSRQALELIRAYGIEPVVVDYLKVPPSAAELTRILGCLGMEPRALLRTREPEYALAGLDDPAITREALILAMVRYPILIERPIVVAGDQVVLGRPPENVLRLLSSL